MSVLYLHIGMAKTGTTSIQRFLTRKQVLLDRTGFRYIREGRIGIVGGHHCLAWAVTAQDDNRVHCKQFSLDALSAELDAYKGKVAILSSEEFSLLSFKQLALDRLFEILSGYDIRVVVYVREQAEFFNSFYVELVSDLRSVPATADAVMAWASEERYNYSHWFEPWRKCSGGNLVVRPFDPETLLGGSVVSDFVSTIGADHLLNASAHFQEQNTSLTNKQIAALKGIISLLEQEGLSRRNVPANGWLSLKRVALGLVNDLKSLAGEPYWGLDADVVATVRSRFRAANDAFFENYYGRPFQFASLSKVKRVNEIEYGELDNGTRYILESAISSEMEKLESYGGL